MRFGILGTTQAWNDDGGELALGGPGRRALLALLLLDAGRTVTTERLIDGLYGEEPPGNVGNALQSQVSRLRGALRPVGVGIEGGPGGYRVLTAREEVDAHAFARLVADGEAGLARGDAAQAFTALTAALGLWRGEPLSDVGGAPFAAGQVVRLAELRLAAVEARAEAGLGLGRARELIAELRAAVAEEPLREPLTALLMRALYAADRPSDALAAYAALRGTLADTLGTDPSPELADLHLAVLRADPALRSPRPAAGGPRTAGADAHPLRPDRVDRMNGDGPGGHAVAAPGSDDSAAQEGSRAAGGHGRAGRGSDALGPDFAEAAGVPLPGRAGPFGEAGLSAARGAPFRADAEGSASQPWPGGEDELRVGSRSQDAPRGAFGDLGPAVAPPGAVLPRPLTSFVGREGDLDGLADALRRARLVTLTGPGGTGKTRLALEAAARYPGAGGACFADLSRVVDAATLGATLLGVLGVRESGVLGAVAPGGGDAVDRLAPALARRGDLLLVLDNCEQVIDESAALAERLLLACPELRVLATSREPLAVPGESVRPLEPLPGPEALRLFAERAAAVAPRLAPGSRSSPEDAAAVAEICRRLDGLPLAIELAAARLRLLTPRQIADRLDDRFRLLTGGSRTAQPRQQTLRAVVDWSWDLLPEAERTLLRRVSVFSGGWTLAAAEAVCDTGPDTLDLLGALVDKSLVVAYQPDGAGEMRYRMLETVRAYAADQLAAADERRERADAHLAHYLRLAETADPLLRTADQLDWLARLVADHDNLDAALRHAIATDTDRALDLLACLSSYWMLRGLRTEGRVPAQRLLAAIGGEVPPGREQQFALASIAAISGGMDTPELVGYIETCRPLMDRLMFQHPLRFPFLVVLWAPFVGVPDEEAMVEQNRMAEDALTEPWYRALYHFGLAFQHWFLHADAATAERELTLGLRGFEEQGDRWGMVMALMELSRARGRQGDRTGASACTDRALALAAELDSPEDMAELLWSRAELSLNAGDLASAETDLDRAVALVEPFGVSDNLASARLGLARVALGRGRFAEAREFCAQALAGRLVGWSSGEGIRTSVLLVLARIDLAESRPEAARVRLGEAESILRGGRNLPVYGELASVLAEVAVLDGRPDTAAELRGTAEVLEPRPDPAPVDAAHAEAFARGAARSPQAAVAFVASVIGGV
ncbi:AfsR/SARP family transcriptional regulator [Streptacidiphilus anmyonensis]|uniref:AfsR/SARP family transcriptional regulator n=1 Tax=Streptacidiphilus anmyonensis TaxID=405782 RepID=UPI0005A91258|nr:BTAD domain-containing putative transcriptional regulator [Streptacidiphilus anmyonensis]